MADLGRRFALVELSRAEIEGLFQPAFGNCKVVKIELLTSGAINTNYRVWLENTTQSYVLRLYSRDKNACRKEFALNKLVGGTVAVPEILFHEPTAEPPYLIMRWVEGILLKDAPAQALPAVGATLAEIGKYKFEHSGFFDGALTIKEPVDNKSFLYDYIMHSLNENRAGQRLGIALTTQFSCFVSEHIGVLEAIKEDHSLVHSDFNGSNILVRQTDSRWEVAAVLDWEWSFSYSPLLDIGNALRNYLNTPMKEAAFLEGFVNQGGFLPTDWKLIARLIDLSAMCEFLNSPTITETRLMFCTDVIKDTIESY
jgi:fructosamine-3-kinase